MKWVSSRRRLVAAGFGNDGPSETGDHRTYQHDRTTQAGAFLQELLAFQIGGVNAGCLESIAVDAVFSDFYPHVAHQLYQVVHVQNVGHVVYGHFVRGEQCGADNLQRLVLGSLRMDVTRQPVSSFDDE